MHQISFRIVQALKFSISAADHERLCLWQFHCAATALRELKIHDDTVQKIPPSNMDVAGIKKKLQCAYRVIIENPQYREHYFCPPVLPLELASSKEQTGFKEQERIKHSIVEEGQGAASMLTATGKRTSPAASSTETKGETLQAPVDAVNTGVYSAIFFDTFMVDWRVSIVLLVRSVSNDFFN